MSVIERRTVTSPIVATEDGRAFTGYAARFNERTYVGPPKVGFWEEIDSGAFTRTIAEGRDVVAVLNHDPNMLLGRTSAGTLRLTADADGLHDEIDLPDTSLGRDVAELTRTKNLQGQSFQFVVRRDAWSAMPGGASQLRRILDVDLIDVGPVTHPQYETTTASVRDALATAPSEVRSAVLTRASGDLVCSVDGAAFDSDDYAEGDPCPSGDGGTLEASRSAKAKGERRRKREKRSYGATLLIAASAAADAALDAAADALTAGNVAQAQALCIAAACSIGSAEEALWCVDTDTLTALGLPDIVSLISAADDAIDSCIAALGSGTTDGVALDAADSAIDAVLAALHIPDADEEVPGATPDADDARARAVALNDLKRRRLASSQTYHDNGSPN